MGSTVWDSADWVDRNRYEVSLNTYMKHHRQPLANDFVRAGRKEGINKKGIGYHWSWIGAGPLPGINGIGTLSTKLRALALSKGPPGPAGSCGGCHGLSLCSSRFFKISLSPVRDSINLKPGYWKHSWHNDVCKSLQHFNNGPPSGFIFKAHNWVTCSSVLNLQASTR
jgi:hypothetical protein